MLYIGERLGRATTTTARRTQVDIAVDPLEGTNLVATGSRDAITVLAASERGGLLNAPDTYFEKLAVGPVAAGKVDIRLSPTENLRADRAGARPGRERHDRDHPRPPASLDLIREVREAGARIKLISDGDVIGGISTAISGTGIHALMGIGAAPEGVLTAAALRCLGGEIQARFRFRNDTERERARAMSGIADEDHVFTTEDLARGDHLVFAATGVTDGEVLLGVRFFGGGARTHSLVMTYRTKTIRFVDTVHMFDRNRPPSVRL